MNLEPRFNYPYRVYLLGQLEVISPSGEPIALPGRKAAALFGYLCLEPGKVYSRESLAELLWPALELKSKQTRLRQELSVLRQLFGTAEEGGLLIITRTSVAVRAEGVETDLSRFQAAWSRSRAASESVEQALDEVISLYRGDSLEGFDELGDVERRAAAQVFEKATRQLAGLRESKGRYDEAVALLERLVSRDPLNEEVHAELMRLYRLLEQPSLVWRQYQQVEQLWQSTLGEPPPQHLRALALRLRQEASVPRLPAPEPPPVLLPSRRFPRWLWGMLLLLLSTLGLVGLLRFRAKKPEGPASIPPARIRWAYQDSPKPGEKRNSEAKAVVRSPEGILCVTGLIETEKDDSNILTLGFAPNGQLLWRDVYGNLDHECDRAFSVVAGHEGSFFVAGESYWPGAPGRPEGWRIVVLKYSSKGERLWEYSSPERTRTESECVRVVLDSRDGIYIGGTAIQGERRSTLITHLDGAGHRLWSRTLESSPEIPAATFSALAADAEGNVYFCGTVERQPRAGCNWLVASYSPTGVLRWKQAIDGQGHGEDQAKALFVDRFGVLSVVGTGTEASPQVGIGLGMAKFSTNGEVLRTHWGPTIKRDLRIDSANLSANQVRLAVATSFTEVNGDAETLVEQFDEKGNLLWAKHLPAVSPDRSVTAARVVSDPSGGMVLTACLSNQPQYNIKENGDLLALHLSPKGDLQDQQRFGREGGVIYLPSAMAVGANDDIVVVGQQRNLSSLGALLHVVAFRP